MTTDVSTSPKVLLEPEDDASPTPTGKAKRRVLVVDDDEAVARLLVRVLGEYEVQWAESGTRAKELLRDTTYDAIVSDIAMPGMDGIQFLREVRKVDLDIPVILLTGSPQLETAIDAIEHGALRYLVKPAEPTELRSIVAYAVQINQLATIKRQAMGLLGEKARAASDRAELQEVFAGAIDSLWMAFQPIVRCSEKKILAYEALLRTREPAFPHPGSILEAAQNLGRLHELGRAVRAFVSQAISALDPSVLVFVNLHPLELSDNELYSTAAPLSAHSGRVVLEITERESLDQVPDVVSRLEKLRAMEYRLALDDLGAGYAGLTSFVQLKPEIVKIDMGLVRGVHRSKQQQRLVGSMLDVCKGMGIDAVTEGVETQEERETLTRLGADLMQGYLFSAPSDGFVQVRQDVFPATRNGLLRRLKLLG